MGSRGNLVGAAVRCALVLLVALAVSSSPPHRAAVRAPNPGGRYEQLDGIRLVCLQGDPYEMGLQQGTLLREPMRELVRDYLYEHLVLERGISQAWLLAYARMLQRDVPNDLRREMQGIADGAGLSYQDVLLLNTAPDLIVLTDGFPCWNLSLSLLSNAGQGVATLQSSMYGWQQSAALSCASFAAWGPATVGGGLLVGHNLDSTEADLLERYLVVLVRRPSQGNAFVSAGLMGMVGVWAGMNEEKVTVTLSSSPSVDVASSGQPLPFVLRRVLEHAGDLDQALHILLVGDRLCGGNVVVGDGKAPEAIAIEVSAHCHAVFGQAAESQPLARTNHFLDSKLALGQRNVLSRQERAASEARLERLETLLQFNKGWFTEDKALDLLRDDQGAQVEDHPQEAIEGARTFQSILLCAERLTMWVAQDSAQRSPAQGGVPTADGSHVSLALTSLLLECLGSQ